MKKIIMSVVALAIISMTIGFVACKKEKENNQISSNYVQDFKLEMQKIGAIHNEGMAFIYNNIVGKKATHKNLMKQVQFYGNEFIKQHEYFKNDTNLLKTLEQYNNVFIKNEMRNSSYDDSENNLSDSQKDILNDIDDIINNFGANYSALTTELDTYENDIMTKTEINEEDMCLAIVACEIAKASFQYWYENGEEWGDILSDVESKESGWFNWSKTGKNDIAGAVSGAAGAGIAAIFGPVGWGAVGVSTLSGAVAMSARSATMQVLDHYYPDDKFNQ